MARRDDFAVGLTVIAVIAAVIAAAMWIGRSDPGRRRPHVEARFRDVGNIQVGNALVLRGVRAGQVEGVELDRDGWVRVRFAVDPRVELPNDPVVLLGASSLFGEWQATVLDRASLPTNPEVREAIREASGARGVIAGATLPDLEQLTVAAGKIASDIARVTDRAHVAFDDSAARSLRVTFRNLGTLSTELERTVRVQSRSLAELTASLRGSLVQLESSSGALQRTMSRADSATSDGELREVVSDTRAAAAQLRAAASQVEATARRLGDSQSELSRLIAHADSVAAKVDAGRGSLGRLVNDPALYVHGDSLVTELRALVADLKTNPRRYFSVRVF